MASRRAPRELLLVWGPALLVVAIAFAVAISFVEPAPPRAFVLACGPPEGAYYKNGVRYAELLAERGITARLVETSGSVENLELLADPASDVEVAFVQGGVTSEQTPGPEETGALVALGSLYHEPIWLFCRAQLEAREIRDLGGLRLGIGAPGSGTQFVARELLALNGLSDATATLTEVGGPEAAEALESGALDALFVVGAPDIAHVDRLARSESVRLLDMDRAPAYRIHARHLAHVVLPEGALDLAADVPAADTNLVAAPATLVARDTFHPALVEMLLEAARRTHASGGIFEAPGEFPSPRWIDRPLSEHAEQFYESGLGFLNRVLPFWAANLIKRLFVLLIPFLGLLIPLMKIVPALYAWRIRSRVSRWYKALLALDAEAGELEQDEVARRLERISQKVASLTVPPAYANSLYDLRFHVERVRRRLGGAEGAESPS